MAMNDGAIHGNPQALSPSDSPTFTGITAGIKDYQYVPVDAGMDSVTASPDAAIRVQGAVGSQLLLNGTSAVWVQGTTAMDTLTVNANHIDLDSLVNTAGTGRWSIRWNRR